MPKSHLRKTDVPGRFWSLLLLAGGSGEGGIIALTVQMLSTQILAKVCKTSSSFQGHSKPYVQRRSEEVPPMHTQKIPYGMEAINHISV